MKNKKMKNCKNCKYKFTPRAKNNKFCCAKCYSEFYNKKRIRIRVFSHDVHKLNKICCVQFCEEKAIALCNRKFYCRDHWLELREKRLKIKSALRRKRQNKWN